MYLTTAVTQQQDLLGKNFMLTFPRKMEAYQAYVWSNIVIQNTLKKKWPDVCKSTIKGEWQKIFKNKLHPFTLTDSTYKVLITLLIKYSINVATIIINKLENKDWEPMKTSVIIVIRQPINTY